MKSNYIKPDTLVISLLPREGLLITGSNQGYPVDTFESGLSPSSFDSGLTLNGDGLFF